MKLKKLGLIATIMATPATLYFAACDTEPATTTQTLTLRSLHEGAFELDGDVADSVVVAGDDWASLFAGGGSFDVFTGVIADPAPTTIFKGGRKDTQDIDDWGHKTGAVPDKDDITNAYAVAYTLNGDLLIYFGADRFANDGDAQLGFWFFKDEVTEEPNGSFDGLHVNGDLLILVNFVQGGTTPEIEVLEWNGGNLTPLESSSDAQCGNDPDADVCAITNDGTVDSPWTYVAKDGSSNVFPEQSFFEGGVNITKLLGGADAGCFATFMAETRSSTSITATLKDYVLGSFNVCGISISQQCTASSINDSETAFVYETTATVVNTGFGAVHDVTVQSQGQEYVIGTLGAGASAQAPVTFESDLNPATSTATVTAATSPGGEPVVSAEMTGSVQCPAVDLDPAISVTKECSLGLANVDGAVVVVVNYEGQVCNDSAGADAISLNDVTVTDDAGTPDDSTDDTTFSVGDLAPGACTSYGPGSYTPSSTNSTDPVDALFADTVTAAGTASLGFGMATEQGSASCGLCPADP